MVGGWEGHYLMLSGQHIQSQFDQVWAEMYFFVHVEMEINAFDPIKGTET